MIDTFVVVFLAAMVFQWCVVFVYDNYYQTPRYRLIKVGGIYYVR